MKILQKLLLSLFISISIFALIELLMWSQIKDDIYTGDPAYFWKLKPNLSLEIENGLHPFSLQTNRDGFRDASWGDGERWLFLGCSTTLGWGVAQTDGFVDLLDQHFDSVDVINGGQPGWSTQQVLQNIEEFKSFSPTKVFVGLGVRDAQLSIRADKDARPSPWIVNLNIFKWLQMKKRSQTGTRTVGEKSNDRMVNVHRVSPADFLTSLLHIQQAFPDADVTFYQFPQLDFSLDHAAVLSQVNAWKTDPFDQTDFFEDDPIHLTVSGHKRLAEWFIQRIETVDKHEVILSTPNR